jgi:hypothetical protein
MYDGNGCSSGAVGINRRFDCRCLPCTADLLLLVLEGNTMAEHNIATTTQNHSIEIVNGYLTIDGEDKALTPDETDQLLDTLLIWKYGLEAVSMDDLED